MGNASPPDAKPAPEPGPGWRSARVWAGWGITLAVTGLALATHLSYLQQHQDLPWGDAPGHLTIMSRYADLLFGQGRFPEDPFPPALYALSASCMELLGAGLRPTVLAVALYAGLLAAGLARLGLRLQGFSAAALLPLLALAVPNIANYSRLYLLDLPAAALIPWVFLFAWSSDGFRRLLPTLAYGLALAALVLTKYQHLIWVVPLLLLPALRMAGRSWRALAAPLLAALPLGYVCWRVWLRLQGHDSLAQEQLLAALWRLEALLLGLGLLLVALAVWRRRAAGPGCPWAPGLHLALAATLALALCLPWVWVTADGIAAYLQMALGERKSPGRAENLWRAWYDLHHAWPATRQLLLAAGALALAELLVLLPWLARQPWTERLLGQRHGAPMALAMGLTVAAACIGAWATAGILPPNARYYLPLQLYAALWVALPLCRLRASRWALAPWLGLVCLLQVGSWDLIRALPFLEAHAVEVRVTLKKDLAPGQYPEFYYFVPERPQRVGSLKGVEAVIGEVAPSMGRRYGRRTEGGPPPVRPGPCVIGYESRLHVEMRAFTSLADLHGARVCNWQRLDRRGDPRQLSALVLLGATERDLASWTSWLAAGDPQSWKLAKKEPLPQGLAASLIPQ